MRNFFIRSATEDKILFKGAYKSFRLCLEDAVRRGCDLAGADLARRDLTNAALDDARLERAVFVHSNLTGANISEGVLDNADFTGAALYNTCLAWSSLKSCVFSDARFGGTDIAGADISGALFSGGGWHGLDFTRARSLRDCRFRSPDGESFVSSRPPVVIYGLFPRPIVMKAENNAARRLFLPVSGAGDMRSLKPSGAAFS